MLVPAFSGLFFLLVVRQADKRGIAFKCRFRCVCWRRNDMNWCRNDKRLFTLGLECAGRGCSCRWRNGGGSRRFVIGGYWRIVILLVGFGLDSQSVFFFFYHDLFYTHLCFSGFYSLDQYFLFGLWALWRIGFCRLFAFDRLYIGLRLGLGKRSVTIFERLSSDICGMSVW